MKKVFISALATLAVSSLALPSLSFAQVVPATQSQISLDPNRPLGSVTAELPQVQIVPNALLGTAQARTTRTELSTGAFFGIQAAYTWNAPQPIGLGLQLGFDRALGPVGVRLSGALTLGAGGPSFSGQINVLARFAASEQIQVYGGPGATLRSENTTERRLTYGANGVLGLEYSLAPGLWVGVEGQVNYLLNALPGLTPWRFGSNLVFRFSL